MKTLPLPLLALAGCTALCGLLSPLAAQDQSVSAMHIGGQPYLLVDAPRVDREDRLTQQKLQARVSIQADDWTVSEYADWLRTAIQHTVVVDPVVADLSVSMRLQAVPAAVTLQWLEKLTKAKVSFVHGGIYISDVYCSGGLTRRLYAVADLTMPIADFPAPRLQLSAAGTDLQGLWGAQPADEPNRSFDVEELADIIRQHLRR